MESGKDTSKKVLVGFPYVKGRSRAQRRTFRAHGVDSFFKPSNMFHQIMCSPIDPMKEISEVNYQINCEGVGKDSGCKSTYIGKLAGHSRLDSQNIGSLALGP